MNFLATLTLSFASDNFKPSFSDDVFDLTNKKSIVSNSDRYYNFDIHHKAPSQKSYVYGYYVYGKNRRDEVVGMIEEVIPVVNQNFSQASCEKFDIGYFFLNQDIISQFDSSTSIVKNKDDFYLFVCSDCQISETDQLRALYTDVLERSCTSIEEQAD